jgi:hypothetical protein
MRCGPSSIRDWIDDVATLVTPVENMAMKALVVIVMAGLLATVAARGQMVTSGTRDESTVVDATGNLHVPDGYRATYRFLGSWAVEAARGQGPKELHLVYASPGAIDAYRESGRFPDGTVLVKEVFRAATGQMTTGTVSHAESLKGWFVMMKGEGGRYAGNKLWGDGWGWSWFNSDNPAKTTSTSYKTDCIGCHVPARASDWIYVSGYPVLKR